MRYLSLGNAAAAVVVLLAGARLSAQDVKLAEEKPGLIARAKVAYATAVATAQAKVPAGKLYSAEVEEEDGKLIYTLVFRTPGKEGQDEINVNATTGKVESVEHEKVPADAKAAPAAKKEPPKPPAKKGGQ